jgi:riboflavin kinase/FMN adenylyltransferase
MRIFRHARAVGDDRGAVVAIGNFDGLHLGHERVIGEAGAEARATARRFAVLTFEPHPRSVFLPDAPPFRLTPFRSKARRCAELGVELLVALRFDLGFARKSPDDFIHEVLVDGLGVREVVIGYDFVFGGRRRGTAAVLAERGAALGFGVRIVGPVASPGGPVYSSTRIREDLAAGRMREATALLGRAWEIDGRVQQGDRLGHSLGFPTANLGLADYLRPAAGVYAVRARLADEDGMRWLDGAANLGWRPTVGGRDLRLEVHLFDFDGDIYGRHLRVAFIEHLRPEQRFSGLDALKAQIAEDCRRARQVLAASAAPAS